MNKMTLSDFLQIIKRRFWIIAITTITTLGVFLYGRQLIPSSSEVSAILRIIPYAPGDPPYTQLVYAERIMNTYVTISTSKPILAEMRERLSLEPEQPEKVGAIFIPDSELLQITVKDQDPIVARDAANTIAEILLSEKAIRDIQIYLIEPATLPDPVSPLITILYCAIAVVVGIAGGTGLALLVDTLDTRLYTTEQIEAITTNIPVLAKIPKSRKGRKSPYLFYTPKFNQAIRALRTVLMLRGSNLPTKVLLFTSTFPKEGKSTIVANLGISLALIERNVLIIDSDLHFPKIHKIFNLNNEIGLSDYLMDSAKVSDILLKTDVQGLTVLPSGQSTPKSSELVGSGSMQTLINQLVKKFDHIIIDTPPFPAVTDSATISPFVDEVILITRCGKIKGPALREILKQFDQLGIRPSGLVINFSETGQESSYHHYYRLFENLDPIKDFAKTEQPIPIHQIKDQDDRSGLDTSNTVRINDIQEIPQKDNLQDIQGIGSKIELALNSIGIYSFAQLAVQESENLAEKLDVNIKISEKQRKQWIERAQAFCECNNDKRALP